MGTEWQREQSRDPSQASRSERVTNVFPLRGQRRNGSMTHRDGWLFPARESNHSPQGEEALEAHPDGRRHRSSGGMPIHVGHTEDDLDPAKSTATSRPETARRRVRRVT